MKVVNALAGDLNLSDRGIKTRNRIVLNRTVMTAILVECLFADSDDADKYNAKVIARAIVNGLVGASDGEWKLGGIEMILACGTVQILKTDITI